MNRLPGLIVMLFIASLLAFSCTSPRAQAINPEVTQANIRQNICVSGWTKTIRPPVSYTNTVKHNLMQREGIPWADAHDYELDHLIPLQLGGHPRDRRNLVLQPWEGPDGAHAKDVVETRVKRLVCVGRVKLSTARSCMAADWHTCPTH